jgi:hypothetical protein
MGKSTKFSSEVRERAVQCIEGDLLLVESEVTRSAPARLEPPIGGASPINLASGRRVFSFPWHWGADGRIVRSPA